MSPLRRPPYKIAGGVMFIAMALLFALVCAVSRRFHAQGAADNAGTRAGLMLNPGSKVTYNGAEIGRVAGVSEAQHNGNPLPSCC